MNKPSVYYNENNPHCAAWLRRLMDAGAIVRGDVDERSVEDVAPVDVMGYGQCHWFAGIGGWPLALQLAGWGSRPVWTGSCPCQPFSTSGSKKGRQDRRDLWPAWWRIIEQCRPVAIFGEQVSAALGMLWFDRVCRDLESMQYAIAAAVLPACLAGAPHYRERLFFVADTTSGRRTRPSGSASPQVGRTPERRAFDLLAADTRATADRDVITAGAWAGAQWFACTDGKARAFEPGVFPMADGVPGRVGRLRAYGNAIVPQVAAEFIAAYLDVTAAHFNGEEWP